MAMLNNQMVNVYKCHLHYIIYLPLLLIAMGHV